MVFTDSFREKTIYMKAFQKQVPNLLVGNVSAGIGKGSGSCFGTKPSQLQHLIPSGPSEHRSEEKHRHSHPCILHFRFISLGLVVLHKRVCTLFVE